MLVISRHVDEEIVIDGRIRVMIVAIQGGSRGKVRLGIDAPTDVPVHRGEIQRIIDQENAGDGR